MKSIKMQFKERASVKVLSLLILIPLLTDCGSINKTMQSWEGHHKSELYQKWGPPTRTTDDGLGGEILIYETWINTGQTAGQVYQNPNGSIGYTAPKQNGYLRTRMFYVNKNGIIYSWRWQGL